MKSKIRQSIKKMKFVVLLVLLLGFQSSSVHAKSIIYTSYNVGLFSSVFNVIAGIGNYENGSISGFKVDCGTNPPYYDSRYGKNWWTYYFEPLEIGIMDPENTEYVKEVIGFGDYTPWTVDSGKMSCLEVNRIINEYIHVKQFILDEVDEFVRDHFLGSVVVGVHYRGTDKYLEAPKVAYESVRRAVISEIIRNQKEYNTDFVTVFIATDEKPFLEYMIEQFPGYVCYLEDIFRSSTTVPVHHRSEDYYENGKSAMLDCILLSRCDSLIRTSSNLSRYSTFLNPDMPVIELSGRY